jgi:hypothetical protein
MEFPGLRPVDLIKLLPWQTAPWMVLAILVGVIGAAAFYVVAGRGLRSLPTYLILGVLAGPLSHLASTGLPHPVASLTIGEVDLVLVTAGTWGLLLIARLLRL